MTMEDTIRRLNRRQQTRRTVRSLVNTTCTGLILIALVAIITGPGAPGGLARIALAMPFGLAKVISEETFEFIVLDACYRTSWSHRNGRCW